MFAASNLFIGCKAFTKYTPIVGCADYWVQEILQREASR